MLRFKYFCTLMQDVGPDSGMKITEPIVYR